MNKTTFHLLKSREYPAKLSIVIPMFNEEDMVDQLRLALEKFLKEIRCEAEVILVNDGSFDATLVKLTDWGRNDERIKVIHLSRNFGHQIAATAGLDYAKGDAVVLMDADLQDPLSVVHEMIDRYCDGYDVIYGQRRKREGETALKLFTAWFFYRLMRSLVDARLPVDTGDFRLISRECLDGLRQMREVHRFLRGMTVWIGFSQIAVLYQRAPRLAGKTKYSLYKMLAFAWTAASSFSALPLRLSVYLGAVVGLFGIEEVVRALLASILKWYVVPGWTSLMIVTCIIGSAILLSIGMVGEYVARIYEESKGRPLYLVAGTTNIAECLTTSDHHRRPGIPT
jgi:polyisoprenyl-phosphate glycosyltransferase